jgi:endonuclease G
MHSAYRWVSCVAAALALAVLGGAKPCQAQSDAGIQLTLGNPSGATRNTAFPTNYLISKPQFALSYHRNDGIPNWVSWHLGTADLGAEGRCNCFAADTTLPAGRYRVPATAYQGSGFDRGHMTASADRTRTPGDNRQTFLMTNILPQAPDNNQGPWVELENYLRSLVRAGNELYIVSGGDETQSRIDQGRVRVPGFTFKVIMVLPNGSGNDLSRVTSATRLIAVSMPNRQGIRGNAWRTYRTSVDQVEAFTGLDFFSAVPLDVQRAIEARVDTL